MTKSRNFLLPYIRPEGSPSTAAAKLKPPSTKQLTDQVSTETQLSPLKRIFRRVPPLVSELIRGFWRSARPIQHIPPKIDPIQLVFGVSCFE